METLLTKVRQNLILEHEADDPLLQSYIVAAISYAERYQHLPEGHYLAAIQKMVDDAAEVIATVREGAMLAMEPENAAKLEAVDREILATQEQMLAMHKQFTAQRISAEAYNEAVRAASVKIQELEEQREELETVATRYAEVKVWLDAFEESTRTGQIMTATDAVIMKTLVEEILVDDYGFEVKFKCGASVEQEYLK